MFEVYNFETMFSNTGGGGGDLMSDLAAKLALRRQGISGPKVGGKFICYKYDGICQTLTCTKVKIFCVRMTVNASCDLMVPGLAK